MRLSDFSVLTFDCYGTLIDWESGILAALAPWRATSGVGIDDDPLLAEFGLHESAQESETPAARYPAILADVLRRFGAQHAAPPSDDMARAFGDSIADWPAFPDSASARCKKISSWSFCPTSIRALQENFKLVVLSNVDRGSFMASEARLGIKFDAVYTAQDIGSYKPDPRNFDYLLARLGERGHVKSDILHVAQSLYHDHVPAQAMGLATCWIDRNAGKPGATKSTGKEARYDFRFTSLGGLAEAYRAETSAP